MDQIRTRNSHFLLSWAGIFFINASHQAEPGRNLRSKLSFLFCLFDGVFSGYLFCQCFPIRVFIKHTRIFSAVFLRAIPPGFTRGDFVKLSLWKPVPHENLVFDKNAAIRMLLLYRDPFRCFLYIDR